MAQSDRSKPGPSRGAASAPARTELLAALGAGAVGGLGLLGGPRGALDSVALLAWLALVALPAGWVLGMVSIRGARRAAVRVLAPAIWTFELFEAEVLGPAAGEAGSASLGLVAVAGLFFLGVGLGALSRPAGRAALELAPSRAGAALLALLALSVAPVALGSGFGPLEPATAPRSPRIARLLIDLDPEVFVLESAGIDWTHRQGTVYRRAGIEWIERRPWSGVLAPGVLLVVGWALASVAVHRRRDFGAHGSPDTPGTRP